MEADWTEFDGWAVTQGFDPLDLPVDRLLSVIYFWATKDGDESGKARFDTRLYMPPKGVAPTVGPWTAEAETSAFSSFKAQMTG